MQARLLTAYLSTWPHGKPSAWNADTLFEEGIVDNYGAIILGATLAEELVWEWQAVVLDCQPGTRWFLEVNSYDGRFLLDPYGGRIVTVGGAADLALPFPDAFETGTLYKYTGNADETSLDEFLGNWSSATVEETAAWRGAYAQACFASRYTPMRTMQFPIVIDTAAPFRTYGKINGSAWDVDAAFAATGETRSDHAFLGGYDSPVGPIVIGHRLILTNTVAGRTYRYSIRSLREPGGVIIASTRDAELTGFKRLRERDYTLGIIAKGSRVEVSIGMNAFESLAIDAMAAGEFSEGEWP